MHKRVFSILSSVVVSVLVMSQVMVGVLSFPQTSHAQSPFALTKVGVTAAIAADSASVGGSAGSAGKEGADAAIDGIARPLLREALRQIFLNLLQFVANRVAYDTAVALASAGTGQTALIEDRPPEEYFRELGLDIAGEAIESLNDVVSETTNIDFGICRPENPIVNLSLQVGLRSAYQRPEPRCDFNDFLTNWEAVASSFQTDQDPSQALLQKFAESYNPGTSELSAAINLNVKVRAQVQEKKTAEFQETIANGRFKNVVDRVTGQVTTPSTLVLETSEERLIRKPERTQEQQASIVTEDEEVFEQIAIGATGIFLNTLISNLANNIFSGLFAPSPAIVDPFNPFIGSSVGREAAEEQFLSFLSAPLLTLDNYDLINEYVTCPGDAFRSQNNCVINSDFLQAITAAQTGSALTVREAIEAGYINENWRLISPDDALNEDFNCHTQAFCHSNLVKLRQARVLPVGWELAAEASPAGNPYTLKEVIDGFHICNSEGSIENDPESPFRFCHLIDPNWVLKFPKHQCDALAPGELPVSDLVSVRQSVCVDSPSCVLEDDSGQCIGGYGYCTREENVWQFRGDSCPAEFSGCLALTNTRTGVNQNYLLSTTDADGCTLDNAGCRWYRTQKFVDDQGNADPADDTFEFFPAGESYIVADRDDDIGLTTLASPASYTHDSGTYTSYAFEDRLYLTDDARACTQAAAGCTELVDATEIALNLIRNPGFETDEDNDNLPDFWDTSLLASNVRTGDDSFEQLYSLTAENALINISQTNILLQPNRFYTLSLFTKDEAPGADADLELTFSPTTGSAVVDLAGTTTVAGDNTTGCTPSGNLVSFTADPDDTDVWARSSCTFTTPSFPTYVTVDISASNADFLVDAVQLELGSVATAFRTGYGTDPAFTYLRVAPDWLGCTGAPTDPDECADYTQQCTAQDVGCELYNPESGGPSIPAITSSVDVCPNECVGYTSYRQEATPQEAAIFPLYFIGDTAQTCSLNEVGCQEYTNLNTVALGGEGLEYYSELRSCVDTAQDPGATFYTWEGSETEGFQLRSWQLLESDLNVASHDFEEPIGSGNIVFTETNLGSAPCTNPVLINETEVVCQDSFADITTNTECNEYDDIFTNPDCREFYDVAGNIHYREFSLTATASSACAPYRKNESPATGIDDNANGVDDGVEAAQLSCLNTGGFWTTGGFCRYYALADESTSCAASANGCRQYTGASGRNATTTYFDSFEDGDIDEYKPATSGNVLISTESLAVGGSSARIINDTFSTFLLREGIHTATQCDEGDVCEATLSLAGGDVTCDIVGTDEDDFDSCGTLLNAFSPGKTYVLEFWAKGSGTVNVDLQSLTTGSAPSTLTAPAGSFTLDPDWQLYEIGPINTNDAAFNGFTEFVDLVLVPSGSVDYYIDNISFKETEENLALIKNSWITPSTCDQTPSGIPDPQRYLGCDAYSDRSGTTNAYYQFTQLCSENVVGCQAFHDTQNSDSPYAEVFNATCANDDLVDNTDTSIATPDGLPDPVVSATACTVLGETVCTIAPGRGSCFFDLDGGLPNPLPSIAAGDAFDVSLGPEAVVVTNDTDIFLVDNGGFSCAPEVAGCMEVGVPAYTQDRTEVLDFTSAYYINDPDSYDRILCTGDGLFCEAWSHAEEGQFFFRDPIDQKCEWRDTVTIDNQNFEGWFRSGTNQPCYFDDLDGDGVFDADTELVTALIENGTTFGVWRNGDTDYAGWVATCNEQYDLCTEFLDRMDTSGGEFPLGTPYYYLKNEKISEENLAQSQRCNGEVSLDEGCGLFFDAVQPEVFWNASASFNLSNNADIFFGDTPGSLQLPVSCEGADTDPTVGEYLTPDGDILNICRSRCQYEPTSGYTIEHPYSEEVGAFVYTGSCTENLDCPTLLDTSPNGGELIEGTCVQNFEAAPTGLQPEYDAAAPTLNYDDVNDIRKVERDRQCAEWLTCNSSTVVWDPRTGRNREICFDLGLCTQVGSGEISCSQYVEPEPRRLTPERYSQRDVSWYGLDYVGYSIPGALPVKLLEQVNINPPGVCFNNNAYSCSVSTDCFVDTNDDGVPEDLGACIDLEEDVRLAFRPGLCADDTLEGETCYIGRCSDTGDACAEDGDCVEGGSCNIGFCNEKLIGSTCTVDADCTAPGFDSCVNGTCTDVTTTACSPTNETAVCGADTATVDVQCVLDGVNTQVGTCLASQCLLGVDGDPFDVNDAEEITCRAHPEQDAPYPHDVVTSWTDPAVESTGEEQSVTDLDPSATDLDWTPHSHVNGYSGVTTCAPNDPSCQCVYKKVSYGDGVETRYYAYDTSATDMIDGICFGGDFEGSLCESDNDCNESGDEVQLGRCLQVDSTETLLGLEGYCLERDNSIKLYNQQNGLGVCSQWYPIDQLTGGISIYNNDTSAGFPLTNAFYCSDVSLYYDLYVTGVAGGNNGFGYDENNKTIITSCAESRIGLLEGNGYPGDPTDGGLSCNANEYDSCWLNAHCPYGYFAIVGTCDDTDLDPGLTDGGQACVQGSSTGGADDDCPYFCVPFDAEYLGPDGDPDDADRCEPPDTGSGIYTALSEVAIGETLDVSGFPTAVLGGVPWQTETYLVPGIGSESLTQYDGDWIDRYKNCARLGLGFDTPVRNAAGDTPSSPYAPMPEASRPDDSKTGYYRNYNRQQSFLGCREVALVSSLDPGYGVGNKAWTNRIWPDSPELYALNAPSLDYDATVNISGSIASAAGGIEPGALVPGEDPDTFELSEDVYGGGATVFPDQTPVPIQSCRSAGVISVDGNTGACTANTEFYGHAFPDPILGYGYEYLSATAPFAFEFESCSTSSDCSFNTGAVCQDSDPAEESCFATCEEDSDCLIDGTQYGGCVEEDGSGDLYCGLPVETTDGCTNFDPGLLGNLANSGDPQTVSAFTVCATRPATLEWTCTQDWHCEAGSCVYGDGDSYCSPYYSAPAPATIDINPDSTGTPTDSDDSFVDSLSQFFGKVYAFFRYEEGHGVDGNTHTGRYSLSASPSTSPADVTETPDSFGVGNNDAPDIPEVRGLGVCFSNDGCREDEDNPITLNGVNQGTVAAGDGFLHATAQFFAFSGPNQAPMREVVVDWGDDTVQANVSSGSNYYRNRRGLLPSSQTESYCDNPDHWGETPSACVNDFFTFNHDYTCSTQILAGLNACSLDTDGDGNPGPHPNGCAVTPNGPCQYVPRVHIKDNWGYCTGTCGDGFANSPADEFCYDNSDGLAVGAFPTDECDLSCAAGETCVPSGDQGNTTVDPWVYYNGVVEVLP